MNTTVSCELHLRLVVSSESSLPVPAGLRYDTADPYAVHATFHTGAEETVEWVFARDLLAEGLHRPTGTGDVRVWPSRSHGQGVVCIALSSPEGEALLEAPARALESFLKRTDAAVPRARSTAISISTRSSRTSWRRARTRLRASRPAPSTRGDGTGPDSPIRYTSAPSPRIPRRRRLRVCGESWNQPCVHRAPQVRPNARVPRTPDPVPRAACRVPRPNVRSTQDTAPTSRVPVGSAHPTTRCG